jgi:circadian clock protein KaiB
VQAKTVKPAAVPAQYALHLYISGAGPASKRAVTNVRAICEEHLKGRYDLEVVDILQSPGRLERDSVIAAPTLIRTEPLPVCQLIGAQLTDKDRLFAGLAVAADT